MMILRGVNLMLLLAILISAVNLISVRYSSRVDYAALSQLKFQAEKMNQEYTRLQLEAGTYSSNLVLQNFARSKFGLVQPDKLHMMEIK